MQYLNIEKQIALQNNTIDKFLKQVVMSKSKNARTNIRTENIKSGIMQYFNIEKQIALHNNTIEKFLSKWDGAIADGNNIDFGKIM